MTSHRQAEKNQRHRRRRGVWRRLAGLSFAIVLIAGACGDSDGDSASDTSALAGDSTTTSPPETPTTTEPESTTAPPPEGPTGPAEYMVMIDGRVDEFNAAFFAYFPDKIKVHPGDTIVYHSVFSGEPHSVTFGDLTENAIAEFEKLTPEQLAGEGPPPPELEAAFALVPAMLPDGPGDANQISVNPCFVAEGEEMPDDPTQQCPVTEADPFTGTEVFYNSGFVPDNETFVVKLADDIPPGEYLAFCTLHFTEMISEVTVVPADEPIPSPEEVAEMGREQLEAFTAELSPVVDEAETTATHGHVAAGLGSEETTQVLAVDYIPRDIEAAVGEPVTWTIAGPHTVSFNPPENARTLLVKGDDGGFHLVEEALAPAGFEPPAGGPPPEDGPPPPLDAGTWDGTGFLSSGFMFGGDFILTFSEPGTYDYVCLVHPEMQGTVTIE